MFKPSHGCRSPHLNVDVLRAEMHRAELLTRHKASPPLLIFPCPPLLSFPYPPHLPLPSPSPPPLPSPALDVRRPPQLGGERQPRAQPPLRKRVGRRRRARQERRRAQQGDGQGARAGLLPRHELGLAQVSVARLQRAGRDPDPATTRLPADPLPRALAHVTGEADWA